ncbi:MAG: penicillin-binding protein 2 [Actinobacteria bacterium]|nr:MAG: penicillin-binding protein 2 [Actinomycetota bacterium]
MATVTAGRQFNPLKLRLALIGIILLMAWGVVAWRLVQVQVVTAPEIAERGLQQRLVSRELPPQRGKIFDRNGDLLAMTVEAESLYAVPGQVEEPLWVAQQFGTLLGVDPDVLYDRLTSDKDFVYIKRQVDGDVADELLALGVRGVYSLPESTRVYPAGEVASHVVGFVNIDGVGQEGLEIIYEDALRGIPGQELFERDKDGVPIPQGMNDIIPAVPGVDLNTTIDLPLQYQAQQACEDMVAEAEAEACWVVAIEVETGAVLAMTGAPAFDPNTKLTVDGEPFSNFNVRGIYEPGSTQKLITFAAALEEQTVEVGTVFPNVADVLELREGACEFDDDEVHGCYRDFDEHETVDMTVQQIFTQSSNVGTIRVAETLGEERLVEYIQAFGLGTSTGVDYGAEASGILNFAAGCETCWASGAIGYSVAVTPLQMAAAYAAIGNDGVWTTPHIVSSTIDAQGQTEVASLETRVIVSEQTARLMRELLAGVVESGTGQSGQVDGYRVGGKTGTANKLGEDGRYTEETRASFVGMAPIDDPKVVVAVVIDAPSHEYRTGGASAAPVFSRVMEHALHRLGVTPDGIE